MTAIVVAVARGILYLVAFFWVFGIIPVYSALGVTYPPEKYDGRRDLAFAAVFVVWVFAGYALFRWVIPAPINPFYEG
jgi:hypothetical protein